MNPTRLPAVFPPEPTPEEVAEFEAAKKAFFDRFRDLPDDDLPCSAGWRGPAPAANGNPAPAAPSDTKAAG